MRPNIRVEIQNNLVDSMEVDENEEGEISEEDKTTPEKQHVTFQKETIDKAAQPTFSLGKNEQDKLQERAKRFHLNPEEIKNFRDEDLQLLHVSLGIIPSNKSNVRFEVIHMRGIEQMTAADILDYFLEYAPVSVEWIDEECCNVVWTDSASSSRALHFISKPVRGMPVRDDTSYFDHLHLHEEEEEEGQSILLKNREVELKDETEESASNKLLNEANSVDISEITATIPPGYWRLGNKSPKSKCLLLRFSLKTDKKHFKTEQFSRYYKKNFKVTVTQNRPVMQTTQGIFGRNKDLHGRIPEENPWSTLAKNWDEDARFREKERSLSSDEPKIEIKNQSLRVRLGTKRTEEAEPELEGPRKKIKIPRMRMYADEEEEKIKRKQMLNKINTQMKKIEENASTNSDLRTVLNMTSRSQGVKIEKPELEVFDLGSRLKNRNKKMVFEIKREVEEGRRHHEKPRVHRRKHSSSEEEEPTYYSRSNKPQSKVAVVIKTQKKPSVASAVASTIWSRVSNRSSHSESEESSESESESEAEETVPRRFASRPGFTPGKSSMCSSFKNPLKIEINNDHFKRS